MPPYDSILNRWFIDGDTFWAHAMRPYSLRRGVYPAFVEVQNPTGRREAPTVSPITDHPFCFLLSALPKSSPDAKRCSYSL